MDLRETFEGNFRNNRHLAVRITHEKNSKLLNLFNAILYKNMKYSAELITSLNSILYNLFVNGKNKCSIKWFYPTNMR